MGAFGKSVTGKIRKSNQDAILVHDEKIGALFNLFVVADGMGGHLAGEIASKMAISEVKNFISNNEEYLDALSALSDAVLYANEKIYESGSINASQHGMGTTVLAASMVGNKAYIVNVGDSRFYAVNKRKAEIKQITVDHSYVMELLKQGRITADEAENHPNRNIITRALGTHAQVECDRFVYDMNDDDILLMCSDGLTNMLTNDDLLKIFMECGRLDETVDKLLINANEKGGIDNISVILYCGNDGV